MGVRAFVEIVDESDEKRAAGGSAVDLGDEERFIVLAGVEPLRERAPVAFDELGFLAPVRNIERHEPIGQIQHELAVVGTSRTNHNGN